MYYKEKSFAFGVADGGLARFGRVTGVHNPDKGVKEHFAGGVERHAMLLNIGVCFVRVPLKRDALQFVLNPHANSVLTVYVRCKYSLDDRYWAHHLARPNPANGTSEMSVPKRPFAACGKLCDRRPPFTDHSRRMTYMITADGSA
jgi:hypothetical protein